MEDKKKQLGLGTYRLLLSYMVIASHTIEYHNIFKIELGTIAVSTFFFISGYLMLLTYEVNYAKFGLSIGFKNFFINRVMRLFPIYWATLLIPFILAFIFYAKNGKWEVYPQVSILGWLQNILLIGLNQSLFFWGYVRINNPAWTLDVELQYYLLVPFIFTAYKKYRNVTSLGLAFLSIVGLLLYFRPLNLVDIDRSFFL